MGISDQGATQHPGFFAGSLESVPCDLSIPSSHLISSLASQVCFSKLWALEMGATNRTGRCTKQRAPAKSPQAFAGGRNLSLGPGELWIMSYELKAIRFA
jgi:hypothetical protein